MPHLVRRTDALALTIVLSDGRSYWDAGVKDTLGRGEVVVYSVVGGAIWGGIVGALFPRERWERFDVAPRTGYDPRRRRMESGLAFVH
jgi:hypothetical protein